MINLLLTCRTITGYKLTRKVYRTLDKLSTSALVISLVVIASTYVIWRLI